jgi:hypothetical protein
VYGITGSDLSVRRATLLPNNVEPNDPQDLDDEALDNFVNQEFFAYLKMPHLPMREHDNKGRLRYTDPLKWWSKNSIVFPTLLLLVKRLLCIPATSAPSERVFSAAGLTISKDRASLLPEHASDMIFLKKSWDIALDYDKKRNML